MTPGYAPTWDVGSASLLWVADKAVHRLHPGSETHTETVVPQPIGAALPRTNGGLVLNLRDGIGLRDPDGRLMWLVYWHRDGGTAGPAAIDPTGNLWAATADQLIRVQPDGRAKVIRDGVHVTGLAWTDDRLHLATSRGIESTVDGGEARPRCEFPGAAGLCVDADGQVWVAVADEIVCVSPTGTIDHALSVPGATGCCFGGNDFSDLYVTADAVHVIPGVGTGIPTARFPG
jgi:sugar lactone lactonase YvrE